MINILKVFKGHECLNVGIDIEYVDLFDLHKFYLMYVWKKGGWRKEGRKESKGGRTEERRKEGR